jgi:hypothetical protein
LQYKNIIQFELTRQFFSYKSCIGDYNVLRNKFLWASCLLGFKCSMIEYIYISLIFPLNILIFIFSMSGHICWTPLNFSTFPIFALFLVHLESKRIIVCVFWTYCQVAVLTVVKNQPLRIKLKHGCAKWVQHGQLSPPSYDFACGTAMWQALRS